MASCNVGVIEDADQRPGNLQDFHKGFPDLSATRAIDMTRALGLRGHFSYVLLHASDHCAAALEGEQLW